MATSMVITVIKRRNNGEMKERNSNIELLRIIAMAFIVIWHISIHAQRGEAVTHDFIAATTTTGVNLFLLITGYFGLRLRWKSYLNIIAMVIFYNFISIALNYFVLGVQPGAKDILLTLQPFRVTTHWFVDCYIILLLLSPILNIIKEKATNKQYFYLIGILVYLSCFIGLVMRSGINRNGYCVMQFVTMYYIGDALKRFNIINNLKQNLFITTYIACTIILYIGGVLDVQRTLAYNNPVLMLAAISLFCFVAKRQFTNKHINSLAKYMFPVYLLQESFFGNKIYHILYNIGVMQGFCNLKYLFTLLFYIAILFVSAITLETIRKKIMNRPIDKLSNFLDKRVDIFP